tara:strand:- start:278 stop:1375 length:1098 start_codon:yes stop_codon:yes gene_type:complete
MEDVPEERRHDVDGLLAECAAAMDRLYGVGAYRSFEDPALFLYRLEVDRPTGRHSQTGIVGLVPVVGDRDHRILRHEEVRPDRTELMARHLVTVGASSSPISLAYRADADLDAEVARCCAAEPVLVSGSEGVDQVVWAVTGSDAEHLADLIGDRTLYVTDGHHRMAAAAQALQATEDAPGPLAWTQAVLFPDQEMLVLPFHRRVGDALRRLPGDLLEALWTVGSIEERDGAEAARPDRPGRVGVYLGGRWYSLVLPAAVGDRAVDLLDVARLQDGVLGPVFGIVDPGSDPMLDYVPDPAGLEALAGRCDEDGRVGFVTHPLSVTELMAVADAGELMPPKSSYFEPKPRSGVFLRRLDREINSGAV